MIERHIVQPALFSSMTEANNQVGDARIPEDVGDLNRIRSGTWVELAH